MRLRLCSSFVVCRNLKNLVELQCLYRIEERVLDPEVAQIATRHFEHAHEYDANKAIASHTRKSFDELYKWIDGREIVMDAGCGTGRSTRAVASSRPDCVVVGVDRSTNRLDKNVLVPDNAFLVRAELSDFWRLLYESDVRVQHTLLLYPNPSPKRAHRRRRWYAHPALPWLLATSGDGLTVRASWRTYLEEFKEVTDCLKESTTTTTTTPVVKAAKRRLEAFYQEQTNLRGLNDIIKVHDAVTNFEAKYLATDTPIYELTLGKPLLLASE